LRNYYEPPRLFCPPVCFSLFFFSLPPLLSAALGLLASPGALVANLRAGEGGEKFMGCGFMSNLRTRSLRGGAANSFTAAGCIFVVEIRQSLPAPRAVERIARDAKLRRDGK